MAISISSDNPFSTLSGRGLGDPLFENIECVVSVGGKSAVKTVASATAKTLSQTVEKLFQEAMSHLSISTTFFLGKVEVFAGTKFYPGATSSVSLLRREFSGEKESSGIDVMFLPLYERCNTGASAQPLSTVNHITPHVK